MWESILSVGTRPSPGCDAICLIYCFCLAEAGQSLRARVFPRVRNAVALSTEIYCSPGDKEPFVSYEQSHCPLFAPHPPWTFHSSLRSVSTTQKVDSQSPGAPRLALRDVFSNCRGTQIWLKGKGEERKTPPPTRTLRFDAASSCFPVSSAMSGHAGSDSIYPSASAGGFAGPVRGS